MPPVPKKKPAPKKVVKDFGEGSPTALQIAAWDLINSLDRSIRSGISVSMGTQDALAVLKDRSGYVPPEPAEGEWYAEQGGWFSTAS